MSFFSKNKRNQVLTELYRRSMLTILILVLCEVFTAHGRPGSLQRVQRSNGASPTIIGGSDASSGEYPYMLSIQYNSATTGWGHFCGGALYNYRYAITTAHCLDNKPADNLRVVAGAVLLVGDVNSQEILITGYTLHPNYAVDTGLPNDIAIANLAFNVVTGGSAQNAVLPPDDSNIFLQSNCFLSGWGQTVQDDTTLPQVLQELQTPVIDNGNCAEQLTGFDNAAIFDTHICTQSPNLDAGPCDADAGSPLTCCRSETDCAVRYVAGILSHFVTISGECSVREPAVSVRISKFLTWIRDTTP
jgi:secreted trypsin-like serine protease